MVEPELMDRRLRNARHRRRCAAAIRARPATLLGPVDAPPWNLQRRLPGTTRMMHGAPARVLAPHRGRNLRFNGRGRARAARGTNAGSLLQSTRVRFAGSGCW
jgi:hypothetical protein